MDLRLQFSVTDEDEFDFASPGSATFVGLAPDDVEAMAAEVRQQDPTATVSVELGSAGKGASGPAVQVILHLGETVLNDGASAFAWGTVLWNVVKRVQEHYGRRLKAQDPEAVGLLAAGARETNALSLVGARVREAVCLTSSPGMGAGIGDVWMTPIVLPSGDVRAIFSSSDGTVLSDFTVPAKWNPERGELSAEDVVRAFRQLNQS